MTIGDLIEELKKLPADYKVITYYGDGDYVEPNIFVWHEEKEICL